MFKALLLEKDDAGFRAGLATLDEARLPEGDVLVQPEYSTINFKDGLAPVSYTHLDVYKRQDRTRTRRRGRQGSAARWPRRRPR